MFCPMEYKPPDSYDAHMEFLRASVRRAAAEAFEAINREGLSMPIYHCPVHGEISYCRGDKPRCIRCEREANAKASQPPETPDEGDAQGADIHRAPEETGGGKRSGRPGRQRSEGE